MRISHTRTDPPLHWCVSNVTRVWTCYMHRWGFALIAMDVAYDADMNAFILDVNSGRHVLLLMKEGMSCRSPCMLVTLKEARRLRWHACRIDISEPSRLFIAIASRATCVPSPEMPQLHMPHPPTHAHARPRTQRRLILKTTNTCSVQGHRFITSMRSLPGSSSNVPPSFVKP